MRLGFCACGNAVTENETKCPPCFEIAWRDGILQAEKEQIKCDIMQILEAMTQEIKPTRTININLQKKHCEGCGRRTNTRRQSDFCNVCVRLRANEKKELSFQDAPVTRDLIQLSDAIVEFLEQTADGATMREIREHFSDARIYKAVTDARIFTTYESVLCARYRTGDQKPFFGIIGEPITRRFHVRGFSIGTDWR